jgi:hypothetical protein
MGAVIVNRTALVSPPPISHIEALLSIPIVGIIPPAPDLCASAQNVHIPLVTFDAESLAGIALGELSKTLIDQVPLTRHSELSSAPATPARVNGSGASRAGVR